MLKDNFLLAVEMMMISAMTCMLIMVFLGWMIKTNKETREQSDMKNEYLYWDEKCGQFYRIEPVYLEN